MSVPHNTQTHIRLERKKQKVGFSIRSVLILITASLCLCSCSIIEKILDGPKEVVQGERRDVINYIPDTIYTSSPDPQHQPQISPITDDKPAYNHNTNRQGNLLIKNLDALIKNDNTKYYVKIKISNKLEFNGRYNLELPSLPLFESDLVYLLDASGTLLAVDLNTKTLLLGNKKLWQNSYFNKYIDNKFGRYYIGGGLCSGEDTIFVTSGTIEVAAFAKKNGKMIWHKELSSPVRQRPLLMRTNNEQLESPMQAQSNLNTAAHQILLMQGMNGTIYALNPKDGSNIWTSFDNSTSIQSLTSSFSSAANKIVAVDSDDKIYSVDLASGAILWQINPVPTMVMQNRETNIVAKGEYKDEVDGIKRIDANHTTNNKPATSASNLVETNLPASLRTNENPIANTPINDENATYLAMINGGIISLSTDNGQPKWQKHYFVHKPMWLSGDFLYAINVQNKLIAMDKKSGDALWVYELNEYDAQAKASKLKGQTSQKTKKDKEIEFMWTSPLVASNCLLVMREDGLLLILDATNGNVLQSTKFGIRNVTMITVANQKLYAISSGDIITQFDIGNTR